MLTQLIEWFKRRFGKTILTTSRESAENEEAARVYGDIEDVNLTAIAANKIANMVVTDSTVSVSAEGKTKANARSEYLDGQLKNYTNNMRGITAKALGEGGVILKPWIYNGRIMTGALPQDRYHIVERKGDITTGAFIKADAKYENGREAYIRWEYHTLEDNGDYTVYQIAQKDGREVPLADVPEWAELTPYYTIHGVERMLFAYLKCPVDARHRHDNKYGVPLTYGCKRLMDEIAELMHELHKELILKRVFVGADSTLFRTGADGKEHLPATGLFKLLNAAAGGNIGEGKTAWEVYSPEIRNIPYIETINYKMELLEKAIGVNRGVFTAVETHNATATEIKASMADTFALVDAVRANIEEALGQLVYAFNVYADALGMAPAGDYEVTFDWDYSMRENSAERWAQLREGLAEGLIKPEEARGWIMDEDDETAKENLPDAETLTRNMPPEDDQ